MCGSGSGSNVVEEPSQESHGKHADNFYPVTTSLLSTHIFWFPGNLLLGHGPEEEPSAVTSGAELVADTP